MMSVIRKESVVSVREKMQMENLLELAIIWAMGLKGV